MQKPLSPKQLEFILNANAKWNLAHGPMRSGKTIGSLYAFMHAVDMCPDSDIWIIGHTSTSLYNNVISLLINPPPLGKDDIFGMYRIHCTWNSGNEVLSYKDKNIKTKGVKDDRAAGVIQGSTMSLVYCDEMTLYTPSVIDTIDTRLSNPHSKGFATMNPSYPTHKLKEWIDKAAEGDPNYYALQFMLEDNPFVDQEYRDRIKHSLSGLFYKRNYLGIWCLAEGAIFDFFDRKVHVVNRPPTAAEYFIAGLDVGTTNATACVVIGVNTGKATQTSLQWWVENEYYWDRNRKGRAKTHHELGRDLESFLEPYGIRSLYIDPSAAAMKEELRRLKIHTIDANNDVDYGIKKMTGQMSDGNLTILDKCTNLIREIEGYVWDIKAAEKGYDEPLKKDDHACVVGETEIGVFEKQQIRIDSYHNYGYCINYNEKTKKICYDDVINSKETRKSAEVWELELEDGKKLKATPDHKILTKRGWVELQQLTLSDMIATCDINSSMEKSSI